MNHLRDKLIEVTLAWERNFGVAPSITSAISELDAAEILGFPAEQYSLSMQGASAVRKGFDFVFNGSRYQVKACRPSGKRGSFVTKVPKVTNYQWDYLVWLLYNPLYEVQEAWLWDVTAYAKAFDSFNRLSPMHMRQGKRLR